jgi:hypothetical protein
VDIERLLRDCCGVEDDGVNVKLYVAGPNARPPAPNQRGVRTSLFHLLCGEEAAAVRDYLASHPSWQSLGVGPTASGEAHGRHQADQGRDQQ